MTVVEFLFNRVNFAGEAPFEKKGMQYKNLLKIGGFMLNESASWINGIIDKVNGLRKLRQTTRPW